MYEFFVCLPGVGKLTSGSVPTETAAIALAERYADALDANTQEYSLSVVEHHSGAVVWFDRKRSV